MTVILETFPIWPGMLLAKCPATRELASNQDFFGITIILESKLSFFGNQKGFKLELFGKGNFLVQSQNFCLDSECDISVLKLLGFKTFPTFWMVSDSVSERFGIEIREAFPFQNR